jgi:hypothetical protein
VWRGVGVGLGLAAGLLKLRLKPPDVEHPGTPSSDMLAHPVPAALGLFFSQMHHSSRTIFLSHCNISADLPQWA